MQIQPITLPQTTTPPPLSWMQTVHIDDTCVVNGVLYRHDDWQHWEAGTPIDELLTTGFPNHVVKLGQVINGTTIQSIQLITDARYKGTFERHFLWYYIFEG